jgi:hypothetical protein
MLLNLRTALCTAVALALPLCADTLVLKSGEKVTGIVQKMDRGRITVDSDGKSRTIELATVDHIEFDTPHLNEISTPAAHFQGELDTKEMTRLASELRSARLDSRSMLDQIKTRWQGKKEVERTDVQRWSADKERMGSPLARYRAALDDFYVHLAAQVDDYNKIAREGHSYYMGVKGALNTGSPLVPEEKKELTPKEMLPRGWYDSVYFEGYSKGYKDAQEFSRLTP